MSAKEVMDKEAFDVNDIQILLDVGRDMAYRFIRQVKSYSDHLGWSGKILKSDYLAYINREIKKNDAPRPEKPNTSFKRYATR